MQTRINNREDDPKRALDTNISKQLIKIVNNRKPDGLRPLIETHGDDIKGMGYRVKNGKSASRSRDKANYHRRLYIISNECNGKLQEAYL